MLQSGSLQSESLQPTASRQPILELGEHSPVWEPTVWEPTVWEPAVPRATDFGSGDPLSGSLPSGSLQSQATAFGSDLALNRPWEPTGSLHSGSLQSRIPAKHPNSDIIKTFLEIIGRGDSGRFCQDSVRILKGF